MHSAFCIHHSIVQITLDIDELRIRSYQPDKLETGADWLRDLYLLFDPVRKNVGRLAEEKINQAIDLALATLRARSLL